MNIKDLYNQYHKAVVYIIVENSDKDQGIGTAFHIGSNVYITARHVIENKKIISIAHAHIFPWKEGKLRHPPFYHPDETADIAALIVDDLEIDVFIPLGSHLDDWINDDQFILAKILIMGYPPIPFSREPILCATEAEINAVVDRYNVKHPHFIVSAMARGGFSGGPCLIEWDFGLGLVTESLVHNDQPTELGYMAVLTVEPILVCLKHHKILPQEQIDGWGGSQLSD
ncbi:S1 family peptidase [Herpetosiphon llansteffanensis]|uniref:S1 family peptidase n=1 Tax=Herpetosiphon llansteffanensis TaxID=2094568 RepID=UPI000D7B93DA|nr:serine protease [Herpetosiphon llansteffanensis]